MPYRSITIIICVNTWIYSMFILFQPLQCSKMLLQKAATKTPVSGSLLMTIMQIRLDTVKCYYVLCLNVGEMESSLRPLIWNIGKSYRAFWIFETRFYEIMLCVCRWWTVPCCNRCLWLSLWFTIRCVMAATVWRRRTSGVPVYRYDRRWVHAVPCLQSNKKCLLIMNHSVHAVWGRAISPV